MGFATSNSKFSLCKIGFFLSFEYSHADTYKKSLSFLKNDEISDPHLKLNELLIKTEGVAIFSGTINGLFGQLFNKGKF